VGSGVYLVRTDDKHIGRSLFIKQSRGEMQVLLRALDTVEALYGSDAVEGKSIIDVGANIGTTALPAILEHGFGLGVAIEPEEENFLLLRLNIALNGLDDRVIALRQAASSRSGTSELVVKHGQSGKHWIASEGAKDRVRDEDEVVQVETVTLDELALEGVFDPDLTGMLWIDVEGHEGHVLEGATALTSRGVPIVLEWHPRALERFGDRGSIEAIAERDYTHFAGMRSDPIDDGPRFWLRPVQQLGEYAERFLRTSGPKEHPTKAEGSEKFTDILILRLQEDQVPADRLADQIDLSAVLKRQAAQRAPAPEPAPERGITANARRLLARLRGRREG
jgi:FkbM family methyltransferase